MTMTIIHPLLHQLPAVWARWSLLLAVSMAMLTAADAQPVPYRLLPAKDYQCFVKNWSRELGSVRYALIRSLAEWKVVMNAAAVMNTKKPYGPDAAAYEHEQLVIISQVVNSTDTLAVQKVEQLGDELTVHFTSTKGPASTSTSKYFIGIWLPKVSYRRIAVVGNGQDIGALMPSTGQFDSATPAQAEPPGP